MTWRVAESLDVLLEQLNEAWPARSKVSDGSIGDTSHSNRASDHNPWCGPGVVTARDFTHDPKNGLDCHKLQAALIASRDTRLKYLIWDGRIWRSYKTSASHPPIWTPQPYTGPNPHTKHLHLSVNCTGKDSTRKWEIGDWFDMATKADLREVVKAEVTKAENRIKQEIAKSQRELAVGKTQKTYNPDNHNLKKLGGK